ncbi:MAG TPA: NnrU family protein [Novosphingobium sp.]|nr:NnrU family protein [Novosphingobium sp.]HNN56361.1 NnrU family protein [Novosphingobium sp.]
MDAALTMLVAAAVTFVGTHFALSHPLRGAVTRAVGEKGFQGVYSLVALASFGWMALAFRAAPGLAAPLWDGQGEPAWTMASALTLLAGVLLVGSFQGNPALPTPDAAALAAKGPHGVFHITRHPMMWAMALWAAAHALVAPTPRVLVLTAAIALLALAGSHMQDRKKEAAMGEAWAGWEAKTAFWPRLGGLTQVGAVPWLGGAALWLAATWAHIWLAYVPAGIWRWVG